MSLKRLMFLTSSLATAGMTVFPHAAEAGGMAHADTWGKPLGKSTGQAGLNCDLNLPPVQVQHPQAVGPVAVPPVGGNSNFGTRSSAGFSVARPQAVQGVFGGQSSDSGVRPSIFGGGLNVQRPTGVNPVGGDNVNSGAVNAYRPNNSRLNVVHPNSVDAGGSVAAPMNVTRPSRGLDVQSGSEGQNHGTAPRTHRASLTNTRD